MIAIQHIRNGQAIDYNWNWFHLASALSVASSQRRLGRLKSKGEITLRHDATRRAEGQLMSFKAGDTLRMWRE